MSPTDQLTSLQRRLASSRELTDVLLLETLELCSEISFSQVQKKYVLTELCAEAAWEQAALWVLTRSLPSWTLDLHFNLNQSVARLSSPHSPPFVIEITNARAATAILAALAQAVTVLTKLGLNSQPR